MRRYINFLNRQEKKRNFYYDLWCCLHSNRFILWIFFRKIKKNAFNFFVFIVFYYSWFLIDLINIFFRLQILWHGHKMYVQRECVSNECSQSHAVACCVTIVICSIWTFQLYAAHDGKMENIKLPFLPVCAQSIFRQARAGLLNLTFHLTKARTCNACKCVRSCVHFFCCSTTFDWLFFQIKMFTLDHNTTQHTHTLVICTY